MRKVRLRDLISGVCRDRKVLFGFGGVGVGRGGVLPGMLRRCEVGGSKCGIWGFDNGGKSAMAS